MIRTAIEKSLPAYHTSFVRMGRQGLLRSCIHDQGLGFLGKRGTGFFCFLSVGNVYFEGGCIHPTNVLYIGTLHILVLCALGSICLTLHSVCYILLTFSLCKLYTAHGLATLHSIYFLPLPFLGYMLFIPEMYVLQTPNPCMMHVIS